MWSQTVLHTFQLLLSQYCTSRLSSFWTAGRALLHPPFFYFLCILPSTVSPSHGNPSPISSVSASLFGSHKYSSCCCYCCYCCYPLTSAQGYLKARYGPCFPIILPATFQAEERCSGKKKKKINCLKKNYCGL